MESVKIYEWQNYQPYSDKEQITLQRNNLIHTPLSNRPGNEITFIYTDIIERLQEDVMSMLREIPIVDTETILETEVYYTTKIEGAKTTRTRTTEIHNGYPIKKNDYSEKMVKNCFDATKYLNAYGNKMTEEILLKTWRILTKDACDNIELGATGYRTSDDIQVGIYIPTGHKDIPALMKQFFDFYNGTELENLPIIKAILLHYAFETIHPFCDGNGRIGRLLMNNYLISRGFDAVRAVSFSMAIDKSCPMYDAAFVKSENIYNDCTPLIQYMLSDVMYMECLHILEQYKGKEEIVYE